MKPKTADQTLAAPLLVGLLLCAAGQAQAMSCDGDVTNCFLVRASASDFAIVLASHGLTLHTEILSGDPELALVTGPTATLPETTLAGLQSDPKVLGAEIIEATAVTEGASGAGVDAALPSFQGALATTGLYTGPESPYFAGTVWNGFMQQPAGLQMNLGPVHADPRPEALGLGVVAIIDTGVDPNHPLLQGSLISGYDFILDQAGFASEWNALDPVVHATTETDLQTVADQSYSAIVDGDGDAFIEQSYSAIVDQSYSAIVDQSYSAIVDSKNLPPGFGHGTMVAGLVRWVSPAAMIMPLRVFDEMGHGDLGDIIRAVYYAVEHGANVINMSFSISSNSAELLQAINFAEENGVVCVSSAGNEGVQSITYPATFGNTLGVASIDPGDGRSAFTNYGNNLVTVAAAGEALITSFPGGLYAAAWGTSFSSALVAGSAALLHEVQGATLVPIDHHSAKQALRKTAAKLPGNLHLGKGRLDIAGAFACAQDGNC